MIKIKSSSFRNIGDSTTRHYLSNYTDSMSSLWCKANEMSSQNEYASSYSTCGSSDILALDNNLRALDGNSAIYSGGRTSIDGNTVLNARHSYISEPYRAQQRYDAFTGSTILSGTGHVSPGFTDSAQVNRNRDRFRQ